MSRTDWSRINRRIRECFESANPLECLIRLFNSTEDGWVAFNIAGLLQDEGRLDEALKYYKIAYERLPLPKYKAMAKQEIEKIEKKLAEKDSSEDILFPAHEEKFGMLRVHQNTFLQKMHTSVTL